MKKIKWFNIKNINIFLLAILICIPMISFVTNIDNIIPVTNVFVLAVLIVINYKQIRKMRLNVPVLCFLVLFVLIILINIIIFRL